MRRAAKIDRNQPELVKALRMVGATVQSLASVGEGCPDLLVGFGGINYVLEVKDYLQPPSKRKLTTDEHQWHLRWNGQKAVVETWDDVKEALGL
jgi:Holliday junction resolvase